ncbi:GNAT family N-acetyltransferase [Mangrovicoccus sp. HB161399]|uniref:GNAT family N-acetyltransferase n=1 Tax=Mangrovicoccus sp. HB161399 TaxID=2720392 RepID=UPI001551B11D|nr:GNAT family N-acetyltransferase [Mangrovicoccus sp. HB161399]
MAPVLALGAFGPAHLPAALALSEAEGWPHRAADWELALGLSEGVAALAEGRLVGCGLLTRFGTAGRVSMILVDRRHRGRGIGRAILGALADLAGDLPLGLCATPAGAPLYARFGFRAAGQVGQWQGIAQPRPAAVVRGLPAQAAALDRAATGTDRQGLLAALAERGQFLAAPGGYAVLRSFGRGRMLGPVVAGGRDAAVSLLRQGAALSAGGFLRVDVPEHCGLEDELAAAGLRCAGTGLAMARGAVPPAEGLWGLASQGFG